MRLLVPFSVRSTSNRYDRGMDSSIPRELYDGEDVRERPRHSFATRVIALTLVVLLILGAGATAFYLALS